MPDSLEPRKPEYSSTYFIYDRNSQEELQRLTLQDRMITAGMGGVLPEQTNLTSLRRVLDIACGTGGWAIKAATTYPAMSLVGIDISKPMVEFARAQAQAQHVADRTEFHVMDATLFIEFPPASFDLVNLRFGVSFIRTWEWAKILNELQRVTRPEGIIRITEGELVHPGNGPTLMQVLGLFQTAFFKAGNYFADTLDGITAHLPGLFVQHGIQNIQIQPHSITIRAGTPEGQLYSADMRHAFHTGRPFLQRRGCLPENYDALCQQAFSEMQQADFCTTWNVLTVWGNNGK